MEAAGEQPAKCVVTETNPDIVYPICIIQLLTEGKMPGKQSYADVDNLSAYSFKVYITNGSIEGEFKQIKKRTKQFRSVRKCAVPNM
jgi:hypothetical protein